MASSQAQTKVDLAEVRFETYLGAVYLFPDVDREALEKVLPKLSNRIPEGHGQLQLVNASVALLSIPLRIVKRVLVAGEVWWENPNSDLLKGGVDG